MRLITVGLLVLVCAAAQAGEVYRWVDKQGRVHYGDRPKHDAEQVHIAPPPATGTESAEADAAASKAAECARKKAQLEGYRKASAIKETDGLGRTREYSEAERQQLLALTEQQMNQACAPAETAAQ